MNNSLIMQGIPVTVDGIPAFPLKNDLQQKIEESCIKSKLELDKKKVLSAVKYSNEIEYLCKSIIKHIQSGKMKCRTIDISWRFTRYISKEDETDLKERLNVLLIASNNIEISKIKIIGNIVSSDNIPLCCASSVLCCCLPLLYWIPKYVIDCIYGEQIDMCITFK